MFQAQDQSLRPLATAHLAQTMTLLALPNLELQETILNEVAENPALELLEERVCPNCERRLPSSGRCPLCSRQNGSSEAIVFLSPRDSFRPTGSGLGADDELPEREPAAPEDLATHVLQQLAADLTRDQRALAAYILCSLDEDGFLLEAPAMIARATRSNWADVTTVLDLISHADPPGLATTGPRQALLVQLDLLDQESPLVRLARQILVEAFHELGRREHERIAKQFQVSLSRVRQAAAFIQENLNPYPARAFWGSGNQKPGPDPNVYHVPDVQISHPGPELEGPLMVEIFSSIPGWLRVNPLFREAMSQTEGTQPETWNKQLERASLFVKCIQQRNNTMRRLLKTLVETQRPFILDGPQHLIPITRAQVAEKLEVHESTVSRAVANKSVALPDGRIIPLARFFDRSLPVRDRIREIVLHETAPLTDDAIVEVLREEGIQVARRTVAKYRAQEGILPARLRHRGKLTSANKV